jgi:copper chaperone CopZ
MTREIGQCKAHAIFSLFNLGCESSPSIVERKLRTYEGIKRVTVDYVTDTVLVDFDPEILTTDVIRSYMTKLAQTGG